MSQACIMYRYVPFDEIEKNKYNGTIHYSPNGNVYGYYWYLKALWREWDCIIEDDYESVLPIIPRRLAGSDYELLPELGPYSVNTLHPRRVSDMLDMAKTYSHDSLYPINSSVQASLEDYPAVQNHESWRLDTIEDIETLRSGYTSDVQKLLTEDKDYKFASGIKPEKIVEVDSLSSAQQNALLRIIYNAMHRGIGWSSALLDASGQNYAALSFFVSTHNKVFEIYAADLENTEARSQLLDLVLYNSAGKPNQIVSHYDAGILEGLGFTSYQRQYVRGGKGLLGDVKQWLGAY